MSKIFWNSRGKLANTYKGKRFYTITPLPFYFERRKYLLNFLQKYVNNAIKICDLGCGDGWYINYFSNTGKQFVGVDISEEMIFLARNNNPGIPFYVADDIAAAQTRFDLVYSLAVLAHIDDKALPDFIKSVHKSLAEGGYYIIFEQIAPFSYHGNNFNRRTTQAYHSIFEAHNFILAEEFVIDFKAHRFFERYLAKKYYRYISKGDSDVQRRMNANLHLFFRLLSRFFVTLSFNKINNNTNWGNAILVYKKGITNEN